jgi:murein DD-endopeptidase / murein LD-carboxypeptidase
MIGDRIAASALEQIGTRFRLHGRLPGEVLDCVGLVAHCLERSGLMVRAPFDYSIRGQHEQRISEFFAQPQFRALTQGKPQPGDIACVQCAARQSHLMIRTAQGWIHAHAGLGRIVLTPDPIQWPMIGIWQPQGD